MSLIKELLKNVLHPNQHHHEDTSAAKDTLPDTPTTEEIEKASTKSLEEYLRRNPSTQSLVAQEYLRRVKFEEFLQHDDDTDELTDEERTPFPSEEEEHEQNHHHIVTRDEYEQEFYDMLKKDPTPLPVVKRKTATIGGTAYTLPDRYTVDKSLGEGAYGTVVKAFDSLSTKPVAVKKIPALFEKDVEYQKRILREVKITKHLRGHDNIVCMKDLPPPASMDDFSDIYIVLELMGWNMNILLRSDQEFNELNVQYFIYQILRGLKFVHSAGIVHRDIKPSNILLNAEMDVKICDFGLARWIDSKEEEGGDRTMYVVSRWYRAPELLLMYDKSSFPVDIWSVGCILAELLMPKGHRIPLFKGKDYLNQLEITMQFVGSQKESDLLGCKKGVDYVKRKYSNVPKKDVRKMFPTASDDALDLLSRMLEFNPHKRITVQEALEHPFLKDCFDGDEPTCEELPFWFDKNTMSNHIKRMLYEDIVQSYDEFQKLAQQEALQEDEN
jgi:serine/threonine protein kinase